MLFDCHFHLRQLAEASPVRLWDSIPAGQPWAGVCSCHDEDDWTACMAAVPPPGCILSASWGVHPQWLTEPGLAATAAHAAQGRIVAVGECGFDFFAGRDLAAEKAQEGFFLEQVRIARDHNLALIIHCRKATDMLFRHAAILARLRGVIFHAAAMPPNEALSLLAHGINAYFSFGTPLLWAGRRLRSLVLSLPPERIMVESDAPCQPTRDADYTDFSVLPAIESSILALRNLDRGSFRAGILKNATDLGLIPPTRNDA